MTKLEDLKNKLDGYKTQKAIKESEKEKVLSDLKENYDIKDEDRAYKRADEIEKKLPQLEKRYDKLVGEIEEELEKIENE